MEETLREMRKIMNTKLNFIILMNVGLSVSKKCCTFNVNSRLELNLRFPELAKVIALISGICIQSLRM